MANVKKNIDSINETSENTTNNGISLDIEALIKDAVEKAVLSTSSKYQDKINELTTQLNKKELETEITTIETAKIIPPERMVRIMHMSFGGATFKKGRINVRFDKLFDERRIRFEILDEMFYTYGAWFNDFEIVILDKDVREYYGLEYSFKEHGADKEKFYNLLSLSCHEMLVEIEKFNKSLAFAFLKFYLQEYINGNTQTITENKFNAVEGFFKNKYKTDDLNEMTKNFIY